MLLVGWTAWPVSAADLKFLHHLQQNSDGNFKSKSGTILIESLVPLVSEVRVRVC